MSNKVLKVKYKDPFSNQDINKRIEFPNHFDDLIKWCQSFIEIPESEQYEFIEESTQKKISNDSEYQLIKNQISSKVTKFLLKIVKKDESNNFNLLNSLNSNLNKEEFDNFEQSQSKKLYSLKNDSLNKNENEKKEEISEKITEKDEFNNNSNSNENINSEKNINKSNDENNMNTNENNFENELDSVNSKIKDSITLLVKEKMKKFEDELIDEIYKNVSLNSSKLIEQSKINSSLSIINTNNSNNLATHNNIKCSICKEIIKGELFKCSKCKDFNLCSNCEEFNEHDESHIFIKIRNPKDDKIELNEIPQYKK